MTIETKTTPAAPAHTNAWGQIVHWGTAARTETFVSGLSIGGAAAKMTITHPTAGLDPQWRIIVSCVAWRGDGHYSRHGFMTLEEVLADFGADVTACAEAIWAAFDRSMEA